MREEEEEDHHHHQTRIPQKNTGPNRVKIHKNLKTQLFRAPVMALPFEKQKIIFDLQY